MPQLVAIAVAGALGYAGYKWIVKQSKTAAQKMRAKEQETSKPRDLGELYWDEAAGVYRPRQH